MLAQQNFMSTKSCPEKLLGLKKLPYAHLGPTLSSVVPNALRPGLSHFVLFSPLWSYMRYQTITLAIIR